MMEPELLSPSDGESSHPFFFPSAVGVGTTPWPFGEAGFEWVDVYNSALVSMVLFMY